MRLGSAGGSRRVVRSGNAGEGVQRGTGGLAWSVEALPTNACFPRDSNLPHGALLVSPLATDPLPSASGC